VIVSWISSSGSFLLGLLDIKDRFSAGNRY